MRWRRPPRPAYLKLDVEGFEFHGGLLEQLIAERIPQLGIDFHAYDLSGLKHALLLFHMAGYDALSGLDTNVVAGERLLLHVTFMLTREPCARKPPLTADYMRSLTFQDNRQQGQGSDSASRGRGGSSSSASPSSCLLRDCVVTGGAGRLLPGKHFAPNAFSCQERCAMHPDCVAFTFVERRPPEVTIDSNGGASSSSRSSSGALMAWDERCKLLEVLKNKLGDRQPLSYGVRSRIGSTCGPQVCPPSSSTRGGDLDVIET